MSLVYHLRPATPNIGNDLIVFALRELLREAWTTPRDVVAVPARGVSAVIKSGGLTRQVVHDANELSDGVLIGPGNLFENNGLDVDRTALAALRVPRLIFSVSWGRIFDDRGQLHERTDAMPDATMAAVCDGASGVLVRDAATAARLAAIGVENATIIGCPVLSLDANQLPALPIDDRAAGAALLSVRHPQLMNISPRLQGRVHADVRAAIDGLRRLKHRVVLVCHDPRDLRFAAAFPDVPSLYTEDPLVFLDWLRNAALVLTFRLHSFLPSGVFGTPAVHFSYDERALGLIDVAQLSACDVDYVRAADPVASALALASAPDALRRSQCEARRGWPALKAAMMTGLRTWTTAMEARS